MLWELWNRGTGKQNVAQTESPIEFAPNIRRTLSCKRPEGRAFLTWLVVQRHGPKNDVLAMEGSIERNESRRL